MAAIYAVILVVGLIPPRLDMSVPLRLTEFATMVGTYALWSQRHWAYVLTYYWGLVLSSQAPISPVLTGPDFPGIEFPRVVVDTSAGRVGSHLPRLGRSEACGRRSAIIGWWPWYLVCGDHYPTGAGVWVRMT